MAAVRADALPTPAGHDAHIDGRADPGCETFHDVLHCLTCRVIAAHPLATDGDACRGLPAGEHELDAPAPPAVPDGDALSRSPRARAPPTS